MRTVNFITADDRDHALLLGPKIAEGGIGSIHRDMDNPARVVKLYKSPELRWQYAPKIRAMLDQLPPIVARPGVAAAQAADGGREPVAPVTLAWPEGAVVSPATGEFLGFAMRYVDMARAHSLERLLTPAMRKRHKLPEPYIHRLRLAANLAGVIAHLHHSGHHVIDLKPLNIRVWSPSMLITLVDCDGFSILGADGQRFPAREYSEDYIAPEATGVPPSQLGEAQDRFALAVILFRLLNNGIHPFQGVPKVPGVPTTLQARITRRLYPYGQDPLAEQAPVPHSLHAYLEDRTLAMFQAAFAGTDGERPTALDWHDHLSAIQDPKSGFLQVCRLRPDLHMHFSKGCGLCAWNQARGSSEPAGMVALPAADPVAQPAGGQWRPQAQGLAVVEDAAAEERPEPRPAAGRAAAPARLSPAHKAVNLVLALMILTLLTVILLDMAAPDVLRHLPGVAAQP